MVEGSYRVVLFPDYLVTTHLIICRAVERDFIHLCREYKWQTDHLVVKKHRQQISSHETPIPNRQSYRDTSLVNIVNRTNDTRSLTRNTRSGMGGRVRVTEVDLLGVSLNSSVVTIEVKCPLFCLTLHRTGFRVLSFIVSTLTSVRFES